MYLNNKLLTRALFILSFSALLTACGGGSTDSSEHPEQDQDQNINHAPVISGIPQTSVTVDTTYQFSPISTDADNDLLQFNIINKPAWAKFNSSTGSLQGVPVRTGVHNNIKIAVSDGKKTVSLAPFSITVIAKTDVDDTNIGDNIKDDDNNNNDSDNIDDIDDDNTNKDDEVTDVVVNQAPTLSGIPATTVKTNKPYQFQPQASDVENNSLTFSIKNKPTWADFNTSTGKLQGTPQQESIDTDIIITVSDGTNTVSLSAFSISVLVSTDTVAYALSSGDASNVTVNDLLASAREEITSLQTGDDLLKALYKNQAINYNPGNRSQLIRIKGDSHKVFPILQANKGNTLAIAGIKDTARFAAFGGAPMEHFAEGNNLSYEPQFKRLLAWLITANANDTLQNNKTIALSFTRSDTKDIKNWLATHYANWTVKECNDAKTLTNCYVSADLIMIGWQTKNEDANPIKQALENEISKQTPVLYLHTLYEAINEVSATISRLFEFELPYGGNYWAKDVSTWNNVNSMQTFINSSLKYDAMDTMLAHFQANSYDFDWSVCENSNGQKSVNYDKCDNVVGLNKEFQAGASRVKALLNSLDKNKKAIFKTTDYRLQKLLALIGDKFRHNVTYPMDKASTNNNSFMRSYYADHAVYNYRHINLAQSDMGNFSRSDFSHITPVTKTVNLTSKKSFRSTGAYALPGQTVKITRNDDSDLTVKVFINTLRSGATHQYQKNAYNRPKYLQTPHFLIKSGETIEITSPYGGPLQLEFSKNDLPVSVTFEEVGEHAYWAGTKDNASFTQKLDKGDFDWAEVVTTGFEVHSKLDKMRKSVADPKWGSAQALANATERYMSNFPHVLAGFKGPGIDVVDEIHDFANTHKLTIETLDKVKHMNADQATCGYGCSGNPYDAYWAFSPIGHGDVHELGHGLEKSRFRFEGWETHSTTNPYSYYTKSKYAEITGGEPDCQKLPFKQVFDALQASVNESNPSDYLKNNLWTNARWSQQLMVTLQAMMHTQNMGKLENGWHLLARLHILEREVKRAKKDWDTKKVSLGFSDYTLVEFNKMRKNDWMLISLSHAAGLDFRDYLSMMGIAFDQKAANQVASFGYTAVPKIFFESTPSGYCKTDVFGTFLNKSSLAIDGKTKWRE